MVDSVLVSLDGREDLISGIMDNINSHKKGGDKVTLDFVNSQKFSDGELCVDFQNSIRGKRVY